MLDTMNMNFQKLNYTLYSIDFALYFNHTSHPVSGINIQMLILVVKLYVFSDYILRKRVPKSQNFNRSHFSLSFHKKREIISFCICLDFLNIVTKSKFPYLFGALGNLWKLQDCAETLFMLQPTYWMVLNIGIKVWGYLRGRNIWEIFIFQINIETEFWLWYSIETAWIEWNSLKCEALELWIQIVWKVLKEAFYLRQSIGLISILLTIWTHIYPYCIVIFKVSVWKI